MKLSISPNIKLYAFIGGIALLLTLVIRPFLPEWFAYFKVKVEKDTRSIPNPCIQYRDLDHDGFSEMAALKYQQNINESALKIYAYNGGLIDQWTFEERWIPKSMIFGDYNHDGHDEVYVFTKTRDSLFLYAIDYHQMHSFLLERIFIARAPSKTKKWDIRPVSGVFLDTNNDGYDELFFNVMAGFAASPRGLFCYDIRNKKLLYQSPPGSAFLSRPQKVNARHKDYILMAGSFALGNSDPATSYSDHSSWLVAFDPHLKFAFPPVEFKHLRSEVTAFPFGPQNEQIIVLMVNKSKSQPLSLLSLYNWQGEEVKRLELHGREWELVQSGSHPRTTLLIDKKHQLIYRLSSSFELNNPVHYPVYFSKVLFPFLNLDQDFPVEMLTRQENTVQLFDHTYQYTAQISLSDFKWGFFNISIKRNGNAPSQLYLQSGEEKYFFSYRLNPLYPFHYFRSVLLFIILSFMVWLGTWYYNNFSAHKSMLHSILSNPARGILVLAPNGKISFMNHTIADQFKLDVTEFKGQSCAQLFSHYPSFLSTVQDLLQNPVQIKQDLSIDENGIDLKATFYAKPITVLFGVVHGLYIEVNDYSQPIRDDRLKVWSKTVQKMAHDIKAPLSSIGLNLSTLKMKLADIAPEAEEKLESELELMLKEINRLRERTNNFLKFTNLEPPQKNLTDIIEVVKSTLKLFDSYAKESVQFFFEAPDKPVYVLGDAKQLHMGFQALIENAIDAIKGQGSISISISVIERIDKKFQPFVEIDIADTGSGIPEEIQDRIFEPYFTTKKEGTGMGLAIAKKIFLDHDGEIRLFSSAHFSTIIKIMLPIGNHVKKKQPEKVTASTKNED